MRKLYEFLPVTITSCERFHSKVKLIGNYMRATMDESPLASLLSLVSKETFPPQI